LQNLSLTPNAIAPVLEKTLDAVSHLGAKHSVCLLWWSSLTKDMQTEQLLCWSGISDTEHRTTASSNEDAMQTVVILAS